MSGTPPDPVDDNEILYRRTSQLQVDPMTGAPNSMAFRTNHDDGLSMIARSLQSADECLAGHDEKGLVSVTAMDARSVGCTVVRDPEDPCHILIQGLTGGKSKALTRKATVVRKPPV